MKIPFIAKTYCRLNYATRRFSFGVPNLPPFKGEKLLHYTKGSPERKALEMALKQRLEVCPEIPCVVNGKEIKTNETSTQVMPTNHKHKLCSFHTADKALIKKAIDSSMAAKTNWERMSFEARSAIFYRAAELIKERRAEICAAVMLGTGKNAWQAEIDAAAETIDFLRSAPHFAQKVYSAQPSLHSDGVYNRLEHRPLEGFVAAISPFNFAAIGVNLVAAPAMMGNVALWKPSQTSMLGNYIMFKILEEAGVPPGVINFLPTERGAVFSETVLADPNLSGLHFTGSSDVFDSLQQKIAENLKLYRNYPRVVGETGGKNFHLAHLSADSDQLLRQSIRAAFEYSGQKCSALSRLYVPKSMWEGGFGHSLAKETASIKVGQPDDFGVFVTSVIDRKSFDRAKSYIEWARESPDCEIVAGGQCDDSKGYFVHPTIVKVKDPKCRIMRDELFAPILGVYVYEDGDFEKAARLCAGSSYALTGAVFARDRAAIERASELLLHAAGNFYVNDKCTGAVVGEQPFGGSRRSGTNDKAGSLLNLVRWVSPRNVKENFGTLETWRYPHMR